MIEHLISTTHRLVSKILLSLRLRGTVAYIYTRMDHFWHYNTNNAGESGKERSFDDYGVERVIRQRVTSRISPVSRHSQSLGK